MFNKILVFGIGALSAILIVENFAVSTPAFVFLEKNSSTWKLALIATLCGIAIGYGIKGLITDSSSNNNEDNLDF